MTYLDITKYFGTQLSDIDFQNFLKELSCDPKKYNIAESQYILSNDNGIEVGFKNKTAVYDEDDQIVFEEGNPVLSVINIRIAFGKLLKLLPFDIKFSDTRTIVREKAGNPIKVVDYEDKFFNKQMMIDHYKIDNLAISIDYDANNETIDFIQIRDNNQTDTHLKI